MKTLTNSQTNGKKEKEMKSIKLSKDPNCKEECEHNKDKKISERKGIQELAQAHCFLLLRG